ncbi:MAG: bacillithiol system redox-active protein YtxJ [Flavobacteriaceae bacterium]
MGIFSNLFSAKEDTFSDVDWIPLNSMMQLNEILVHSGTKKQVIFKHSTRCGVSGMVIKQFEKQFTALDSDVDLYFLDLLRFRDISNAVASKFNVIHQSPQLIVIKNKKVIAHDSHHGLLSIKLN